MTFHPLMFQKLKPHIFTVGEQTYRSVKSLIEPVNQSVVVSGESGAGKVRGPLSHPVNFVTGWTGREAEEVAPLGFGVQQWAGAGQEVKRQGSSPGSSSSSAVTLGEILFSLSLHFLTEGLSQL